MENSRERVRRAFNHENQERIPRGELWLASGLFEQSGLEDDLAGHVQLRTRLGMDLLFLPASLDGISADSQLGYRYFTPREIDEAAQVDNLFVGVIIDGPFQRMAQAQGLSSIFRDWCESKQDLIGLLGNRCTEILDLIGDCVRAGLDAIVIADDIAWDKSTYLSPEDLRTALGPLYADLVKQIKQNDAHALFHSCGDIKGFLPDLVAVGFDGLAGIQSGCTDLVRAKQRYGDRITLIAGIEDELLQPQFATPERERAFAELVRTLSTGGGFILGSSCGLYAANFVERLPAVYDLADRSLGA
jgi:hypothetical protein